MKRGIEMSWAYDYKGRLALRIEKKRGKLTLAEIQDLLMYEESQRYCGHYAIILNCSEAAMGGDDLYLEDGQKGDTVALYQIEEGETCPVCAEKSCQNAGSLSALWLGLTIPAVFPKIMKYLSNLLRRFA